MNPKSSIMTTTQIVASPLNFGAIICKKNYFTYLKIKASEAENCDNGYLFREDLAKALCMTGRSTVSAG